MVMEYKPNVIGVSATDATFFMGIELISKIRNLCKDTHIIIGGIYPTFCPQDVINNKNVDSICRGEGEQAFVELCKGLENGKDIRFIPNLWVKTKNKIYKNDIRKIIDIDTLPYEDFDIFEKNRFFRPMDGKVLNMLPISTDRGCIFNCSFCAAPSLRKMYNNCNFYRKRDINKILEELRYQINKYNIEYIYFNSENFLLRNLQEIKRFAKKYSQDIGLPFWCQTHIQTLTEEKIKIIEDMNCKRLNVGIEHGNEEFRKKVLFKNFTNKHAIDIFKKIEKSKIKVVVNNMIGFPDETRELVFDTICLNRQIKSDSLNVFFFVPYSGTALRQYCIDKKYLLDNSLSNVSIIDRPVLKMSNLSINEIEGLVRTFPLYVKLPKKYYKKIKIAETDNVVFNELKEIFFKYI